MQYFEDFWGQKRAEINVMDDQDLTPLQVAAQKGHLDVVKCLIENGADVHLWNNDFTLDGKHWTTPLHFAAQEGYHEVVKYLLNFFHVGKEQHKYIFKKSDHFMLKIADRTYHHPHEY